MQAPLHPVSLLSPPPTEGSRRQPCPLDTSCQSPQATPPQAFLGTNQHKHHWLPQLPPEDALLPSEATGLASNLPSCHHHWLLPSLEAAAEKPCFGVRSGGQDLLGTRRTAFPSPRRPLPGFIQNTAGILTV